MGHGVGQLFQVLRVIGREHDAENKRRPCHDQRLAEAIQNPKQHAEEEPSLVGAVQLPQLAQELNHATRAVCE